MEASEPEHEDTGPTWAELAGKADFVTNVKVRRPGKVVWVDFSQADPDTTHGHLIVARLVLHPDLLDDLIGQLSRVRDGATSGDD